MIPLRLRQLLAVLILLSLISLLLWLVVGPLLSRFKSDEEVIAGLQQRLQVYQRLVTELPAQEARLAELKQDSPMSRLLFAESRPALAGAELQQQIGQLVGQTGAQIVSTQILSRESAEAPVPAVGIKVHLRGETEQLVRFEPVVFDAALADRIQAAAQRRGLPHRRMTSGAGHDAQMLARIAPSAMIFVPSRGGISHNPREHTDDDQLALGAQVLLDVVQDCLRGQ